MGKAINLSWATFRLRGLESSLKIPVLKLLSHPLGIQKFIENSKCKI
jgi:hypothetical protein